MKLCVIGNSHLAAIRLGWDTVSSEFPGLEMTFFGARADALKDLQAKGGRLVPANADLAAKLAYTSGGQSEIELGRFDAAMLVGMNYIPPMPTHAGHSQAVRALVARAAYDATLSGIVFAQVRAAAPDLPVYIMPNPLRRRAPGDDKGQAVVSYAVRLADFQRGMGGPVHVMGQPSETIVDELYTADAYGTGAIALDEGRGTRAKNDGDVSHMNGDYGALMLRRWLPALAPAK
jgi:hypothetical protein